MVDGYHVQDIIVLVPCANRNTCTDLVMMEISFVEGFFPPHWEPCPKLRGQT